MSFVFNPTFGLEPVVPGGNTLDFVSKLLTMVFVFIAECSENNVAPIVKVATDLTTFIP